MKLSFLSFLIFTFAFCFEQNSNEKNTFLNINVNENTDLLFEGWFTLNTPDLINEVAASLKRNSKTFSLNARRFYFKLKNNIIFYTLSTISNAILGMMKISTYQEFPKPKLAESCLYLYSLDNYQSKWELCTERKDDLSNLKNSLDIILRPKDKSDFNPVSKPIFINLPPKKCNQNWNYLHKGKDWECDCQCKPLQSPLEIKFEDGLFPLFLPAEFHLINFEMKKLQVKIENNTPIITCDGKKFDCSTFLFATLLNHHKKIFFSNEIHFHSPSEHIINGRQYDLELQLLFKSKNKGISSILSLLIEGKVGYENSFFKKLNLVTLIENCQAAFNIGEINERIGMNTTNCVDEIFEIKKTNFNYFYYDGSLTIPPCSKHIDWYIMDEPVYISLTDLILIKDSIKGGGVEENNRGIRERGKRKVFYYSSENIK